ncbi:HEAT repeat domain-containing protein [Sphingobacterium bovistauri]|uniref:HEAT repeat domain-containing protein n=1 Tax=Sphingobacterium bovistauri TaxID=2781959 RepID=A0ABS7Z4L2_9SPHI|nr:HEAT repeat domain-containing protein [Sphingobacterium bovistauri]MCA5005113.1 HEAT repeat domain-containing protein [Sphingobacterium bovistauri]
MAKFYDLNKDERLILTAKISDAILADLRTLEIENILNYFADDDDTYIRKTAYLTIGKIWKKNENLRPTILDTLQKLFDSVDEKVRQTTINAAGEIGMSDFKTVVQFFDQGLFDNHHIVRNAVIGSVKKMGEKNPNPTLIWAKKYLHHPDKEIRREICHGIELRGRTHPQDILPLLKELQNDETARVKNTLIHVIGQIAYKKGCLQIVVDHLNTWENQAIITKALDEIVDVHHRYKDFAILTTQQAIDYIDKYAQVRNNIIQ